MTLKLVVAEPRPDLRHYWGRLSNKDYVEVRDTNIKSLLESQDVDCVVMPSWVHERLGGVPVPGTSAVLQNRHSEVGDVRWIATTPTFAASAQDASEMKFPQWPTTARQQGLETFQRVLEAIRAHNGEPGADSISVVGIDPDFLEFNADYEGEVSGVLDALFGVAEGAKTPPSDGHTE